VPSLQTAANLSSGGAGNNYHAMMIDERMSGGGGGAGGFSSGHDLDMDSVDNLSSSHINHSTMSPNRLHSIREEVGRPRNLESQPGGESLGEPLYSNLDSQKRQRFGRPFTNSPFPYMQKRSSVKLTKF